MNNSCHLYEDIPKCINCQGEHWATANICPVVHRQRAIVNMAAVENISIADARKIVNSNTPSPHTSGSPDVSRNSNFLSSYLPRIIFLIFRGRSRTQRAIHLKILIDLDF